MIRKASVCVFIFVVILAAAIAATLSHPDGQVRTYSTRLYQWKQYETHTGTQSFLPREYVKIIRWAPDTTLPDER